MIGDPEDICFGFDQVRPVVSHIEFSLPNKLPKPKYITESLKRPLRKYRKYDLFVQYDKNKNISLFLAPIPIKYLPEGTKVLRSLIGTSIK